MRHFIVPPYLLAHLMTAAHERLPRVAEAARAALRVDEPVRHGRATRQPRANGDRTAMQEGPQGPQGPQRSIYDANGSETLPGTLLRREGEAATGDRAADEAYAGLGATYALFADEFERASIDGREFPLDATVHFGRDYDNAFWDGSRMVFGDGDGEIFTRFTASLSVLGHELSHGVLQYTANLAYQGQSGALNESVSDVFGALVEQRENGEDAAAASWLIGAGLFSDTVQGVALRSLKAPGTAYDDDLLGRDPQPADMAGFVDTTEDYGGVHINSGIPNRAFFLAATSMGGFAWEGAGRVWYDTITAGDLPETSDFVTFAAATVAAASERFGSSSRERDAVAEAWSTVGVPVAA